ncbi:hypothetical protein JJJ17_04475 [Paracoccus caeni]|uniref:Uncharacterized protein n=1 Tax=Paracoccus caeni TaxID=657651 RepID=A0A934VYV6_9RHOB|nr:hypothetical protein [Paracoccus caeni]MBK4215175.1 hypothetical protein [Paracoccus caeni]
MQTVFHLGVHATDDDRLLKTLLNNRETLMRYKTEVVTPNRHRGLFEEALMSLKGGRATPEMVQIMHDAVLQTESPERVIFSSQRFMGAPGRAVSHAGLYTQIGTRASAIANLFPDSRTELFLAIRNPATLIPDVLKIFSGGGLPVLMQGRHPLDLRWREAIQRLVAAVQGRRVVVWCHEDAPMIWPEIVRTISGLPSDAPINDGLSYLRELLTDEGKSRLKQEMAARDQITIAQRREISAEMLAGHAAPNALDQEIDLPGWTQELIDQMTANYRADVAEIAVLPGVEFILPLAQPAAVH